MNISVRSAGGSPVLLTHAVADAITSVDRTMAITLHPLARDLRATLNQERLVAMLSGSFGGLALLLAGVGLHGVMSYTVTRRRAEIGLRMALGATPGSVFSLVMKHVTLLFAAGVAVGLSLALWAARFVAPLVFGVGPRDPVTLGGTVALLACVAGVAAWLPARRASRLDPARVLREG